MDQIRFNEWEERPDTQEYLQFLRDYRQKLMEDWAEGCFLFATSDATAIKNAEMVGKVRLLYELSNLSHEAISEFTTKGKEGSNE